MNDELEDIIKVNKQIFKRYKLCIDLIKKSEKKIPVIIQYSYELLDIITEYKHIYAEFISSQSPNKFKTEFTNKKIEKKLNELFQHICSTIDTYCSINDTNIKYIMYNVQNIFNKINTINFDTGVEISKCHSCNVELQIDAEIFHSVCPNCGIQYTSIFDNCINFYHQNDKVQKKNNSYDAMRHFRDWMDCIFACENKEIPAEIIKDICNRIKLDGIKNLGCVSCNDIRRYLKEIRATEYNKNVSKIREIITGIRPPEITPENYNKFCDMFQKNILPNIQSRYYPYFIYKMSPYILSRGDVEHLSDFIHIQKMETQKKNSREWEEINKIIQNLHI